MLDKASTAEIVMILVLFGRLMQVEADVLVPDLVLDRGRLVP